MCSKVERGWTENGDFNVRGVYCIRVLHENDNFQPESGAFNVNYLLKNPGGVVVCVGEGACHKMLNPDLREPMNPEWRDTWGFQFPTIGVLLWGEHLAQNDEKPVCGCLSPQTYIAHYSSFYFLFHYPNITPV